MFLSESFWRCRLTGRRGGGGDVLGESTINRSGNKVGDGRRGTCVGDRNGVGDGETIEDLSIVLIKAEV